jgi:hypothetical protein
MTGVERLNKRDFSTDIPSVLSKWVKINLTGEGGFYTHKVASGIDNTRFRAPTKPYKVLLFFPAVILTANYRIAVFKRGEVWPMPYALCLRPDSTSCY